MSDDKIKYINIAIKNIKIIQKKVMDDMKDEDTIKKEERSKFLAWQTYESTIINLETQRYILESIQDTDKITTLAYRVALISLGASLISILSSLI